MEFVCACEISDTCFIRGHIPKDRDAPNFRDKKTRITMIWYLEFKQIVAWSSGVYESSSLEPSL